MRKRFGKNVSGKKVLKTGKRREEGGLEGRKKRKKLKRRESSFSNKK